MSEQTIQLAVLLENVLADLVDASPDPLSAEQRGQITEAHAALQRATDRTQRAADPQTIADILRRFLVWLDPALAATVLREIVVRASPAPASRARDDSGPIGDVTGIFVSEAAPAWEEDPLREIVTAFAGERPELRQQIEGDAGGGDRVADLLSALRHGDKRAGLGEFVGHLLRAVVADLAVETVHGSITPALEQPSRWDPPLTASDIDDAPIDLRPEMRESRR